jgi:hypothetical protein
MVGGNLEVGPRLRKKSLGKEEDDGSKTVKSPGQEGPGEEGARKGKTKALRLCVQGVRTSVTVDDVCGCVKRDIICCDKPMKKKRSKK